MASRKLHSDKIAALEAKVEAMQKERVSFMADLEAVKKEVSGLKAAGF